MKPAPVESVFYPGSTQLVIDCLSQVFPAAIDCMYSLVRDSVLLLLLCVCVSGRSCACVCMQIGGVNVRGRAPLSPSLSRLCGVCVWVCVRM